MRRLSAVCGNQLEMSFVAKSAFRRLEARSCRYASRMQFLDALSKGAKIGDVVARHWMLRRSAVKTTGPKQAQPRPPSAKDDDRIGNARSKQKNGKQSQFEKLAHTFKKEARNKEARGIDVNPRAYLELGLARRGVTRETTSSSSFENDSCLVALISGRIIA